MVKGVTRVFAYSILRDTHLRTCLIQGGEIFISGIKIVVFPNDHSTK